MLTDRQANAENVRDGLQWLKTETTYRDISMLYMAGHGVNNNVGDFFFLPVNADINRLNATCVGYREIKETIDAVAGKILIFMDACHSGNVLGSNQQRAAMLTQAINDLTNADNGAVVFTSSTGRQFSLENPEWENGAFTKALVEGLNGNADLYDSKTITVKNLDSYITNRVKELTKGQQAPTTIIPKSVPDFPIAFVTAPTQAAIPLPPETPKIDSSSSTAKAESAKTVPAPPVKIMLSIEGHKVFKSNNKKFPTELEKKEVLNIMKNMDAQQMYKKSISKYRWGNALIWSGCGLVLLGAIIAPSADALSSFENKDDKKAIEDKRNTSWIIIGSGGAFVITGITLRINGKNGVRKSVDMYNKQINNTSMDLKFGITGNGVGLALRF